MAQDGIDGSLAGGALNGGVAQADAAQAAPAANQAEQPTAESPRVGRPDPPQHIIEALRALVRGYELESDVVRRHKVRVWREAEEFWKGNQTIWWSQRDYNWHTPFEAPLGDRAADPARYDYSINLYRAWGMSIIAALTQSPPKITYRPQSAESEDDVATAKAAEAIAELVAANNDMDLLRTMQAYYLWTQGLWAGYVRFVVDGGLYGYDEEPVVAEVSVELAPASYVCAGCGERSSADAAAAAGAGTGAPMCPRCGAMLPPAPNQPPEMGPVPVPVGTRKVPRGAEKIDVWGPLYVKLPPQARDQRQCYYLIHVEEQHKATLRAAYPAKAAQIDDVASGAEDTYERIVRLTLADAQGTWNSLPMSSLVTYKRAWLRPEAFWAHADEQTRGELLRMYPDGCRVEFAADTFLCAVPERMDDYWVLCLGLPGIGIYRDGLGYDAIAIQRQINDSANILAEHREMAAAPPVLYDARFVSGEALVKKRMEPASYTPVVIENAGPQVALANLVFQPTLHVDPALWQDGERLAELGQMIVGALPSIFGGGSPNLKTATAYMQAREQAMGRLQLVWHNHRAAIARLMTLAVECFKRNRLDDVEAVEQGKGGEYRSKYIHLNEVRGNAVAQPSADEDFPQSWSQSRDVVLQLLQSKDPELLNIIGAPVNRPIVQRYLGLPKLIDPTEENRSKQFREIDVLLAGQPMATTAGLRPSVPPDLEVDDHAVHVEVIKEWAVSTEGQSERAARPAGYANVIAHLLAHLDAVEQLAIQDAQRKGQVAAAMPPLQGPQPAAPGGPQPNA